MSGDVVRQNAASRRRLVGPQERAFARRAVQPLTCRQRESGRRAVDPGREHHFPPVWVLVGNASITAARHDCALRGPSCAPYIHALTGRLTPVATDVYGIVGPRAYPSFGASIDLMPIKDQDRPDLGVLHA
jgi:hypothetical protein